MLLALAVLGLAISAARAQSLVAGLSEDQVAITSSYAGSSLVVFGAIETPDDATPSTKDVVIVIRGPASDVTVMRKARIAGLWINRDRMRLSGMPAYYYLASTRPLRAIAGEQILARYQLGLAALHPSDASSRWPAKIEPFRLAAIAERKRTGLYSETQDVEFLSYSLFRVRVPIPATVPRGEYTMEAYLFRDGTVASAQSTPLYVDQKGLERRLYRFAHRAPFVYGLSAVLAAVLIGWLSSFLIPQQR